MGSAIVTPDELEPEFYAELAGLRAEGIVRIEWVTILDSQFHSSEIDQAFAYKADGTFATEYFSGPERERLLFALSELCGYNEDGRHFLDLTTGVLTQTTTAYLVELMQETILEHPIVVTLTLPEA